MQSIGAAPPVQREPFLFDTHYRRAEEQLAFHEKYHDRMARLIGTSTGNTNNNIPPDYDDISRKYPNGEGMNYHNPTPDYWADYAKKLEQMGVSRTENTPPRTVNATAPTPPPPQGSFFNSPRELHDPSKRWEAYSNKGSPARFSEEGVLHRLDLLAQDKSEPDTTDVIDLLREVEDVLVREEAQRQDRIDNSINTQSRVGLSSRPLKTSSTYDPGRPMGVPPAPAVNVNFTNHLHSTLMQNEEEEQYYHHHQQQQQQQLPPPPATTPTAAPSFQYGTKCTPPIRPPPSVGADWSQMSNYQQMEWYKSYYAWMMYYAQYYGAIFASQQLQKQKQLKDHQLTKEEVNESNQKNRCKKRTGLRELNREYRELAAEVERLNEEPKPHKNIKTKISTRSTHQGENSGRIQQRRSPSPYNAEDDTLYRSAHSHSSLRGVPLTSSHSRVPLRSKTLVHREYLKEDDESKYGVPKMNEYEKNNGATEYRGEIPWLPPERDYTEDEHKGNKRNVGDRDVSWLYKYEESDTEAMSNTDSGEVGELNRLDNDYIRRNKIGSKYFDHQKEEKVLPRTRRNDVLDQQQQQQQHQGNRLSVYERKRQEMEKSKPRWCF